MREKRPNIYGLTVTVALGGTSGTQLDPCNPLRGTLTKVKARAADDTTVSTFKAELYYYDNKLRSNVTIYTASDAAIPDDAAWHDCDADKDLSIPLSFAQHGNYTWKITTDDAATAAMAIELEVTVEA